MSNHNLTSNSFAPSHPPPPKINNMFVFFFYKKSAFPGSILFYLMKVSRYLIHKTVLLMQERKTEKPITKTIVLSAFPPIPQILSRGQTKRPKVKKNFGVVSHPVHVTLPKVWTGFYSLANIFVMSSSATKTQNNVKK